MIKTSGADIPEGYVNYGACLLTKGRHDEAAECFRKALELNSTHFEAIYNLGECTYLIKSNNRLNFIDDCQA